MSHRSSPARSTSPALARLDEHRDPNGPVDGVTALGDLLEKNRVELVAANDESRGLGGGFLWGSFS
jgi:hypothetical protein